MSDPETVSLPSAVLGEVVWLYSISPLHHDWKISTIHRWIIPALRQKQYRIYHRGSKPIGFVSWAFLSEQVAGTYIDSPNSLRPQDWQSGDKRWFIDFIAPFGDTKEIIRDLRKRFPNETGNALRVKPDKKGSRVMQVTGLKALA